MRHEAMRSSPRRHSQRLVADDAGGAYPFDVPGGARLLVDEADVELVAEILGTERTQTGGSTE
jgi:hypothetical protein